jgi:hypothetical protein
MYSTDTHVIRMKRLITSASVFIVLVIVVASLSACNSTDERSGPDKIRVTSVTGSPVAGATVLFTEDVVTGAPYYVSPQETNECTTDKSGYASITLAKYYINRLNSYGFNIRKNGYRDDLVIIRKAEFTGNIIVDLQAEK